MISETEEVVGKCGFQHKPPPPNHLNSYVFVCGAEANGRVGPSGKGIQKFDEGLAAAAAAEPDDDDDDVIINYYDKNSVFAANNGAYVVGPEPFKLSGWSTSNPINKDDVDQQTELPKKVMRNPDSRIKTQEEMKIVESTEDEAKLSEGEVADTNSEHGSLNFEDDEIDEDANAVVEHETREMSAESEDDEVKLSEGEVVQNAEHENIEWEMEADDEYIGISQDSNKPVAPPRVEEARTKTKRNPFNFLVKVPRFDNKNLKEQIRLAKINVDEKTKLRNDIQIQIQEKRAKIQVHRIDYKYANAESRHAGKLVRSKRVAIDSLQSVVNKAKNALTIGDIDRQIYYMERVLQHETLPLKGEMQLIREMKQLNQLREQLASNMGSKYEIKHALEQREEAEQRLKIFRKELDILKTEVIKAEAAAVEAEKKYDAEINEVKEIQAQFRAADGVRQAAFVQWHSLKKELSKRREYFYKYKDDSAVASNCAFSRDTGALHRLCKNNVKKFMELWNTNDEFRREYVKFNTRSTDWRLGTLDGRSLGPDEVAPVLSSYEFGPDEVPPVLPSYVDTRVNINVSTPAMVDLKSQIPTLEPKQVKTSESVMSDGKSTKKLSEEKNQRAENNEPAISVQANESDTVSGQDIIINEVREEPKKSKEEIEAIKKAEERERKEAEAKLKEERRLEALAKASEARERKKKQAEKLQMRAELKMIKEAEQKEKEREKRLRKKERKKVTESAAETTSKDVEVKGSASVAAPKKLKKHWWFGKQIKAKSSIPPPLRNRHKKKLQQWMWVGIACVIILVMFLMGNMGVFSDMHFRQRGPVV